MNFLSNLTLQNILKSIIPQGWESDVDHKVVIPLLRFLGYSDVDWRDQAIVGRSKIDFLVLPPYLVIQVKAPTKNLTRSGWQISKYMRQSGAFLGLLTNVELDIFPSHIRLSDMASTLIQTVDIDRFLIKKLKQFKSDYDFIFIDPPPSLGKVNNISLMASSGILIPMQLAPYA